VLSFVTQRKAKNDFVQTRQASVDLFVFNHLQRLHIARFIGLIFGTNFFASCKVTEIKFIPEILSIAMHDFHCYLKDGVRSGAI
jgi:hypothetical protein